MGLTELYLSGTNVTDAGLAALRAFPQLESFAIDGDGFDGAGLAVLADLPRLRTLDLSHCTSFGDDEIRLLRPLTGLRDLTLYRTQVSDASLDVLAGLTALQELSLQSTRVTAEGAKALRSLLPNCKIWHWEA